MKKIKDALTKLKNKKILIPTVVILVIVLGVSALFIANGNLGRILGTASNQNQETQRVTAQIGKLIELPGNETPILATVSDITKLSSEDFYQGAMNGDKILVFKSSKMAILYRPSINKIIKVGTVTIAQAQQQAGSESAKTVSQTIEGDSTTSIPAFLRVYVYNGSKLAGLAKTTGESLEAKYKNIQITGTGNSTGIYDKTLIVDLSGKNNSAAKMIAKELNGQLGSLPEGETKPDADVLIIVVPE